MILIGIGKNRHRWILFEWLVILVACAASVVLFHFGFDMDLLTIIVYTLRVAIVALFAVVGWRDLLALFRRQGNHMGTGISRISAVARTTLHEAWAGRIWLLPVLWLIVTAVLLFSVRPFDESERIPLYIKMIFSGQEILVLLVLWVMACVSLPRDREKKVIVTNASKPLSRLEILLGKITGFSLAAGAAMLFMCLGGLLILYVANLRLRGEAAAAYDIQQRDFQTNKTVLPSEALKQISEQGSLFAYNSVFMPPHTLSLGALAFQPDPTKLPLHYLVGGSQEKAYYHFSPNLSVPDQMTIQPTGRRPYFLFYFPVRIVNRGDVPAPQKVEIHVSAYPPGPVPPQEVTLKLNAHGEAAWEPETPSELFSSYDPRDPDKALTVNRGRITLEISCPTAGAMLQILESADIDPQTGKYPPDTETNIEFHDRLNEIVPGLNAVIPAPDPHPVVHGFERRDRQEISAPKPDDPFPEMAIYRFPGKDLKQVRPDSAGNFTLAVEFETFRAKNPASQTFVRLAVKNLSNLAAPGFSIDKEVLEKRVMNIDVPAAGLLDTDPAQRGDLLVVVQSLTEGHAISLADDSVRIELTPTPFLFNYLKSECVLFMEAVVAIAVCVVCSIRLGWPVAMLLSFSVGLFGFMVDYFKDIQTYGGLGILNYRQHQVDQRLFNFLDQSLMHVWESLYAIARAVPNFMIYQAPQEYISKLQNLPVATLGDLALSTAGFLVPVIAIGYLLFRKQELG